MVDSSDQATASNTGPAPWIVQPPSKTAICLIDYPLGDTAELYVIPILVKRQNTSSEQRSPIISQRLRRKAITEYLTQYRLEGRCALQLWARKNVDTQGNTDGVVWPIDELVFFASDQVRVDSLPDEAKQGTILKNTLATIKASDGKPGKEAIHCELDLAQGKKLSAEGTDCTEYWRKIELLVRKFGPTMSAKAVTSIKSGALLQETIEKENQKENTHVRFPNYQTTVNGAEHLKVLFRTTLKLDPDHRKLHAEVDLVPGINGGVGLSDLIASTFGSGPLDMSDARLSRNVKAILVGLAVARIYEPVPQPALEPSVSATGLLHGIGNMANSPRSNSGRTPLGPLSTSQENLRANKAGSGSSSTAVTSTSSFPESVILNLKPASQVPAFWKDDEKQTVVQYLLKTYPDLKETKLLGLPLANIGKDTWVPLEFLKTAGQAASIQQVPSSGHLTASLQDLRANYDLAGNRKRLLDFLNGEMRDMRKRHEGMELIVAKNSTEAETLKLSSNDTERMDRTPLEGAGVGTTIRCGIIYVRPSAMRSTDFDSFAKSLVTRLESHARLDRDQRILDIKSPDTSPIASIPDIKPLLLLPGDTTEEVKAFYDSKVDTIIAVLDERGRSKQEIQYVRAELQKFGNRKLGAVVLCVSRKDLEPRTNKTTGLLTQLPTGILQQLNALHGNLNFAAKTPPSLDPVNKQLMIVGAHISHAGSGAAASCPSVAALVGSVDEALMRYTGSARLQATLKATFWKPNRKPSKLKHEVESQIVDLESMMLERIEAWIAKQGRTHAPHIVFYRHGLQSNHENTVMEETAAISRACKGSTWEDGNAATFDYVLANKNAHVFSPYRNVSSEESSKEAAYEFNIADSAGQVGHKYQYYVRDPPSNMLTGDQFKTLTRHLNSSFQQKDAKIAIALPVHYAQKLAKRMYDYFLFATTNRYDQLSSVQRRLEFSDEKTFQSDQQMADMMNEYLLGYGVVKAREEPQPDRKNPWMSQLDDKMFYL